MIHGEAMIEVDYKPKAGHMDVMEGGADTQLLKEGLYKFDAERGSVEVIEGKASVAENGHSKDIGKGKELMLANTALKPVSVDTKKEDDLYRWSSVRDGYLAQANYATAENMYVDGGWGPGWGLGWVLESILRNVCRGYRVTASSGARSAIRSSRQVTLVYAPRIRAYGYGGFGGRPGPAAAFAGGRVGGVAAGRVGGIAAAPRMSGGGGRVGGGGRR